MRSPNQLRVVGERLAAQDGAAKVKGTAIFTADRALPGMLHAKVLRSPHAHARIRRIDVRRAAQHPGVHAVVTGKDLAGMVAKLKGRGIDYELRRLPDYGTWQLFFDDPNHAKVEIDFDPSEQEARA